ncbi:hypothetical protein [Plantactinospora sp. B5E13]|uniref:hypothetical protein n=1 Tax=unclassified Plantactinospora TaxID=2631981 RepID=UPI00325E1342
MPFEDETARFDWSRIPTYLGYAEMLPGAVRALITAPDSAEADRLGTWIERVLLSVAGPCEGCAPVATVLVVALPEMTPAGRSVALDLLTLLGAAEITGPPHEQIGRVDVAEIRQAVAAGFHHYVSVLQTEASSDNDVHTCVGLVEIAAFHDPSLAAAAIRALGAVRTGGRSSGLAALIDSTVADLTELSHTPQGRRAS